MHSNNLQYPPSQHIIVMGVCGCGKSTIGSLLADKLGWIFFDADDFHSTENIKKMHANISLTDTDRVDWLNAQSQHLMRLSQRGVSSILACSALKASYRKTLCALLKNSDFALTHISFLWLHAPKNIILKRIKKRKAHFMPATMVHSQFETLEEPNTEIEHITCYTIDVTEKNINVILDNCLACLKQ